MFTPYYPNATSIVIIKANPKSKARVAISLLPLVCDSGINSSTQTKIIAPAANAKAYGRITVTSEINQAPNAAPIISTKALACPRLNALPFEAPVARIGIDNAEPSGKFCKAIPRVKTKAEAMVADSTPKAAAPKATPTDNPSGKLWIVTARNNNVVDERFVSTPSASSRSSPICK